MSKVVEKVDSESEEDSHEEIDENHGRCRRFEALLWRRLSNLRRAIASFATREDTSLSNAHT
jgi:hypothetical protein